MYLYLMQPCKVHVKLQPSKKALVSCLAFYVYGYEFVGLVLENNNKDWQQKNASLYGKLNETNQISKSTVKSNWRLFFARTKSESCAERIAQLRVRVNFVFVASQVSHTFFHSKFAFFIDKRQQLKQ